MKLDVLNIQGEATGRSVELPGEVFGIEPNDHVVWLAVKQYLAHQRQGTHKTKERGEIQGSTRKLHRQKGTGSSRKGDIKNPIFRGGGRTFGPRPRKYTIRLNKKVKKLARKSALSSKANAGQIMIVEDFSFDAPKTSQYREIVNSLQITDKRSVLVTADYEKQLLLSSRNIDNSSVMRAQDLNTYQVLNNDVLVLCEGAVEKIASTLMK